MGMIKKFNYGKHQNYGGRSKKLPCNNLRETGEREREFQLGRAEVQCKVTPDVAGVYDAAQRNNTFRV